MEIRVGDFLYSQDEEGEWIYKASPLIKLTQVHGEQVPYKVIEELEQKYSDDLDDCLANALKDVIKYLNV